MVRAYHINGETMVSVAGGNFTGLTQLGLAFDSIDIAPKLIHTDVTTDDFGPNTPAEILAGMIREVRITMTLSHYDEGVIRACMTNSAGMAFNPAVNITALVQRGGIPGQPLGAAKGFGGAGNRFVRLNLVPAVRLPITAGSQVPLPWRFYAAYLTSDPFTWPIGTQYSQVQLSWRAIPFVTPLRGLDYEVSGRDSIVFDHVIDSL